MNPSAARRLDTDQVQQEAELVTDFWGAAYAPIDTWRQFRMGLPRAGGLARGPRTWLLLG
jgi:hypothetical protein